MTAKQKIQILKRFLKVNKSKTSRYEKFSNACIEVGEKFLFTNGVGVLILNEDFGYEHIEDRDFVQEIESLISTAKYGSNDLKIVLTNLKEYNELIIKDKIVFNSNYLYDILKIINVDEIAYTDQLIPCYCENDNGEMAILMPIRKNKKNN